MPIDRPALLAHLRDLGLECPTSDHPALFTVEDSKSLRGTIPGGHTKNLFMKDKKGAFFLVVADEDAAIDLKGLHRIIGCGRLSFAKSEPMRDLLGVAPGSVTPFGLINDTGGRVAVVLDEALARHERVNFHPLTNTATTTITWDGLLRFLESTGHEPQILAVSAPAP